MLRSVVKSVTPMRMRGRTYAAIRCVDNLGGKIEKSDVIPFGRDPSDRPVREPRHTPQFLQRPATPQRAGADDEFEDD